MSPRLVASLFMKFSQELGEVRFVHGKAGYRRFVRKLDGKNSGVRNIFMKEITGISVSDFPLRFFRHVLNSYTFGHIYDFCNHFELFQMDGNNACFLHYIIPRFFRREQQSRSFGPKAKINALFLEPVYPSF